MRFDSIKQPTDRSKVAKVTLQPVPKPGGAKTAKKSCRKVAGDGSKLCLCQCLWDVNARHGYGYGYGHVHVRHIRQTEE